ncbi:7TM diverse intracellular signaling domain-containing protein [Parapedobacter sp. DT-150]
MTIKKDSFIVAQINNDQLYFGLYAGIILVMFFYNFFIYLTVRDSQYLYYVLYILVVGVTQASLKGFSAKFFWDGNTWLIENATHVITAGSGVFSIFFAFSFLHVKRYLSAIYKILCCNLVIYVLCIVAYISGHFIFGQTLLQFNTTIVSLLILSSAITIYKKGYKPALFFWVAWSFFLSGVVVYILKDAGILPFNNFTSNSILIGSGLEAALLSFALADKISIYKRENEESQLRTIEIAKENEKLIREQNIVLEQRVEERTHALKESNESLQKTLTYLKEAQAQLVEAEKMASLGQLTAGVAHEINNPINFVTSNVTPLKRDVAMIWDAMDEIEKIALSDLSMMVKQERIHAYKEALDIDYLKTEIDFLLKGMHEGASRTAEIVKSLRVFSRVDEDSLKFADINEGLESTLVILNSVIKEAVVDKQYGQLPLIECYPGKLNQVFLNIITNALYAINKKFNGKHGGLLEIKTKTDAINAYISISDNGTGMPASVREKIFEPFFTTKEVGEGTGLGMSIAYNTVKKHQGEIKIDSEIGVGTTFTLIIPLKQPVQ